MTRRRGSPKLYVNANLRILNYSRHTIVYLPPDPHKLFLKASPMLFYAIFLKGFTASANMEEHFIPNEETQIYT